MPSKSRDGLGIIAANLDIAPTFYRTGFIEQWGRGIAFILSPYAPHIAEELYAALGHEAGTLAQATFPIWQQEYVTDDEFEYPIQINGKVRVPISFPLDTVPADIEKEVLANETMQKWLDGESPKNVIVVSKRIVNVML